MILAVVMASQNGLVPGTHLLLQLMGVCAALLLIDRVGRRPLLIWGSAICCAAMLVLAAADALSSAVLLLAAMCAFIAAFSVSWAGAFWVLMSEMFSMSVKSPAVSAATAMLFLAGCPMLLRTCYHHCRNLQGAWLVPDLGTGLLHLWCRRSNRFYILVIAQWVGRRRLRIVCSHCSGGRCVCLQSTTRDSGSYARRSTADAESRDSRSVVGLLAAPQLVGPLDHCQTTARQLVVDSCSVPLQALQDVMSTPPNLVGFLILKQVRMQRVSYGKQA